MRYSSWRYAGIARKVQWLGYELGNRGIVVRFLAVARDLCLLRNVRTGSGSHTGNLMGIEAISPGGKTTGAWISPLKIISCRRQKCVELYAGSPHTPSWPGALSIGTHKQLQIWNVWNTVRDCFIHSYISNDLVKFCFRYPHKKNRPHQKYEDTKLVSLRNTVPF